MSWQIDEAGRVTQQDGESHRSIDVDFDTHSIVVTDSTSGERISTVPVAMIEHLLRIVGYSLSRVQSSPKT